MRLKRKVVKMELKVTFEYRSDKDLKRAVKEYLKDPCYQSFCIDSGNYHSWKEGKRKILTKV